MYNLIDRGTGILLSALSLSDFRILSTQLVRADEYDSGYYVNASCLAALESEGLSAEVVRRLRTELRYRGVDLGWEFMPEEPCTRFYGQILDQNGLPLGAIRVTLVGRLGDAHASVYSRPDGHYEMPVDFVPAGCWLRFSGRGDLVLKEALGVRAGLQEDTVIPTLSGRLVTRTNKPVPHVNVQLLGWKPAGDEGFHEFGTPGGAASWGDSDEDGDFTIPLGDSQRDRGLRKVAFEMVAGSGETLGRVVVTTTAPGGLELGNIVTCEPKLEWGGQPLRYEKSLTMYPGVSERPLS